MNKKTRKTQVYGMPRPAIDVLVDAGINLSPNDARRCLVALSKAGFFIGPREPTNSMLEAYLSAVQPAPMTPGSTLNAIAKARARWQAMARAATAVAISWHNSEYWSANGEDVHV
jgi:hypothetical protein